MGSDEAGAASAIRGLGSEPCGASRGYEDCGLPSRAHKMARMAALRRLNPGRARCECPGVLGPHRTAREPIRARQGVAVKPALRERRRRFLSKPQLVTETHCSLHGIALHLAAPFVAARRCTRTGPKLPIDWLYTRRLGFGIRANAHAEQSSSVPVAR